MVRSLPLKSLRVQVDPLSLIVADFNNDGRLDIAGANGAGVDGYTG